MSEPRQQFQTAALGFVGRNVERFLAPVDKFLKKRRRSAKFLVKGGSFGMGIEGVDD
jgi:hypothetical protein